jgi:hypothetical protein
VSVATIYDELRAETPEAPLCSVCGRVDLFLCPTDWRHGEPSTCSMCFQLGLHDPAWPDAWRARHCDDCGCYLDVPYSVEDRSRPWVVQWLRVCADHFAARTGAHVVWRGDTHAGGVAVVDELPPVDEILAAA